MLGKRQRADSELSNTTLGGSIFSTPTRSSAQYKTQFTHDITPPHLTSRTRKRIRDNRPTEEAIHRTHLSFPFITLPYLSPHIHFFRRRELTIISREHPQHAIPSTKAFAGSRRRANRHSHGHRATLPLTPVITTLFLVAPHPPSFPSLILPSTSTNLSTHVTTRSHILLIVRCSISEPGRRRNGPR